MHNKVIALLIFFLKAWGLFLLHHKFWHFVFSDDLIINCLFWGILTLIYIYIQMLYYFFLYTDWRGQIPRILINGVWNVKIEINWTCMYMKQYCLSYGCLCFFNQVMKAKIWVKLFFFSVNVCLFFVSFSSLFIGWCTCNLVIMF